MGAFFHLTIISLKFHGRREMSQATVMKVSQDSSCLINSLCSLQHHGQLQTHRLTPCCPHCRTSLPSISKSLEGRASKHVKEMWKFSKEAYTIASFFSFRGRLWVRSVRLCGCAPLQLGCPGFCTMSLGAVEGEGGIPEITGDAEGKLLRTRGCVPAVTQFLPRKQSLL